MTKKQSKTCIALIKLRSGRLIMAGDRRCSWDWGYAQVCPEPKIVKDNGFLIGGTGDGDLLELILNGFLFKSNEDLKYYMTFTFRKELTSFLKAQGYRDEHNLLRFQQNTEVQLLIGKEGKGFTVNLIGGYNPDIVVEPSIISIGQVTLPFAVGCGADAAIPLLEEMKEQKGFNTKEDLVIAMERACKQSPGCSKPIDYLYE